LELHQEALNIYRRLGNLRGEADALGGMAAVRNALMDHYGLAEDEVDRLLATATRRDSEAVDFYRFTSAITSLDEAERLEIVRMMWQVVFADGNNHELEDNMVWRIAELIGVSARDRTTLRKQMSRSKPAD
jgi:uncharacterized tellurite resistance protein B-like protein